MRAARVMAFLATILLAATACDGGDGDDGGDEPTTGSSDTAAPTGS